MNSSKWLGIGIVAIVLVVGAYLIGQNSNNQASSTNTPAANNTGAQQTSTPTAQQTNAVNPTQQLVGVALQKQCSSDARNFFYQQWEITFTAKGMIGSGGRPSYLSHFNSSLNKCFVEISGLLYKDDAAMGYFSETYLYDVYGGNEIASLSTDSESNTFLCDFNSHNYGDTPNYCTSPVDFNNGINVYMSD